MYLSADDVDCFVESILQGYRVELLGNDWGMENPLRGTDPGGINHLAYVPGRGSVSPWSAKYRYGLCEPPHSEGVLGRGVMSVRFMMSTDSLLIDLILEGYDVRQTYVPRFAYPEELPAPPCEPGGVSVFTLDIPGRGEFNAQLSTSRVECYIGYCRPGGSYRQGHSMGEEEFRHEFVVD